MFCDYDFNPDFDLHNKLAHLILVQNPSHNIKGDFGLNDTLVLNKADEMYTFSGIGYYSPELFRNLEQGKSALAPLLRKAIEQEKITGEVHHGCWHDIGTPQRLDEINRKIT